MEQKSNKSLELTDEGKTVSANGSHEALVYNAIPADGILQAELMVNIIFSSSFIPAKMFGNCSQFRLKMYIGILGIYSYKSEPGCIELDQIMRPGLSKAPSLESSSRRSVIFTYL